MKSLPSHNNSFFYTPHSFSGMIYFEIKTILIEPNPHRIFLIEKKFLRQLSYHFLTLNDDPCLSRSVYMRILRGKNHKIIKERKGTFRSDLIWSGHEHAGFISTVHCFIVNIKSLYLVFHPYTHSPRALLYGF